MIWDQISNFVYDNPGKPMLCMGDLNELLYDMDKSNANVNYHRLYAFRALVKNYCFFYL